MGTAYPGGRSHTCRHIESGQSLRGDRTNSGTITLSEKREICSAKFVAFRANAGSKPGKYFVLAREFADGRD